MNLKRFFVITILLFVFSEQYALSQSRTHVVEKGETISRIAVKYGVTIDAILSSNNKDNDKIKIGETLIIPAKDGLRKEVNYSKTLNSNKAQDENANRKRRAPNKSSETKSIIDIRFFVFSFIVFVVTFLVRKRYWNKIKIKNKETVYKVVIALGIILALLSITGIRKLLWWLIGIAVVGVSSYFMIRKFTDKKQQRGHKITDINELDQLRKKVSEQEQEISRQDAIINQLNQKINKLEKEKKDLFEQNIELGERLEGVKFISKKTNLSSDNIQNESLNNNCVDNNMENKLYAEAISDGILLKVKEKYYYDSIFELDLMTKESASLTILPSAHQRIIANNTYINGCDVQIIGNTNISVTPGKAILNGEGRWEVTVKPVVIIR